MRSSLFRCVLLSCSQDEYYIGENNNWFKFVRKLFRAQATY